MSLVHTLFPRLEARAEPTSTFANPMSWLMEAFGAIPTKAGVSVSESSAETISAVWACMRVISEDVSKIPIDIVERVSDVETKKLPEHPLHWLLNVEPNPEMSAMEFRELLTRWAVSWGNGLAEIERDGSGRPLALWPIHPSRVMPFRLNGRLYYRYHGMVEEKMEEVVLPAIDVLHIKGPSRDGVWGQSVIKTARQSMGLTMATEIFGASFFGNGARPSGVLTHPKTLSPEAAARLRAQVAERYAGPDNAGKPMVLEEDMKWVMSQIPPEDAQFLQTRQFQIPEACRWFRVPPHKIADHSRSTFNNIEQLSRDYVTDSLLGWMVRWEQDGKRKLVSNAERRVFIYHDEKELTRGDVKSQAEAFKIGRDGGWLSADDIRYDMGLNPLPDGQGKIYTVPANMTTPDKLGEDPKADPPAPAPEPAAELDKPVDQIRHLKPLFVQAVRNSMRIATERIAKLPAKADDSVAALAEIVQLNGTHFRGQILPIVEAAAAIAELQVGAGVTGELVGIYIEAARNIPFVGTRSAAQTDLAIDEIAGKLMRRLADMMSPPKEPQP